MRGNIIKYIRVPEEVGARTLLPPVWRCRAAAAAVLHFKGAAMSEKFLPPISPAVRQQLHFKGAGSAAF